MASQLGVAVVHGIGRQKEDFADGLIREVSRRLGDGAERVRWMPVWWAPIAQTQESALLDLLAAGGDLDWVWARRLVVHFLADAVAYQRVPGESDEPGLYVRIHAFVAQKLTELREQLGVQSAGGEPPLMVIAHSLGGHIMSNYIWDQQHPKEGRGERIVSPFVRAETLAAITTFGCNIPLFALALPRMVPIQFPPASLPGDLKAVARWNNLYDPDDILGFPLASLSDEYARTVHDFTVNVGGLLTSWNPICHDSYWTDNDVTKRITEQIQQVLANMP